MRNFLQELWHDDQSRLLENALMMAMIGLVTGYTLLAVGLQVSNAFAASAGKLSAS